MKVSRLQMAENRQAILRAAGRLFREQGFQTVSVAEVMQAAGLTHGGFYGHFRSKQDLMAQACTTAAEPAKDAAGRPVPVDPKRYLTAQHRADRAGGCVFAALAAEATRQTPPVREALTDGLRATVALMAEGQAEPAARNKAIAAMAGVVGGLILARLTADDPAFSDEILDAVRGELTAGDA